MHPLDCDCSDCRREDEECGSHDPPCLPISGCTFCWPELANKEWDGEDTQEVYT